MERNMSYGDEVQLALDFQNYEEKALRMADEDTAAKVDELVEKFQEAIEKKSIEEAEKVLDTLYQMSGEESFWEEG